MRENSQCGQPTRFCLDAQQDQVNRRAATDVRQVEGAYRRVRLNEWKGRAVPMEAERLVDTCVIAEVMLADVGFDDQRLRLAHL